MGYGKELHAAVGEVCGYVHYAALHSYDVGTVSHMTGGSLDPQYPS